jgi:hypothetical protein
MLSGGMALAAALAVKMARPLFARRKESWASDFGVRITLFFEETYGMANRLAFGLLS